MTLKNICRKYRDFTQVNSKSILLALAVLLLFIFNSALIMALLSSDGNSSNPQDALSVNLLLDKNYYQENDIVNIFIQKQVYGSSPSILDSELLTLEIYLKEDPNYIFRYLGLIEDQISFIPERTGNYIVKLYYPNTFVVDDTISKDNIEENIVSVQNNLLLSERSFLVYNTGTDECQKYYIGNTIQIDFNDYWLHNNLWDSPLDLNSGNISLITPKSIVMIRSYETSAGNPALDKWVYSQKTGDIINYTPSREGKYSLFADDIYLGCFNVLEYIDAISNYVSSNEIIFIDNSIDDDLVTDNNNLNNYTSQNDLFTQTEQYISEIDVQNAKHVDRKQALALAVIGNNFYADANTANKIRETSKNTISGYSGLVIKDSKDNIINAYIIINETLSNDSDIAIIEGDVSDVQDALSKLPVNPVRNNQNTNPDNAQDVSGSDTTLYFSHDTIKKIELKKLRYTDTASNLYIEDVSIDKLMASDYNKANKLTTNTRKIINSFAIDPTSINFTDGLITIEATGSELYKCKEWNFKMQECFGEWVKIADLIPGEFYNITLSPEDPAFTQTQQPDATIGKDTDLNQNAATTNTGAALTLRLENRASRNIRALLDFDLSGIPSNAKILSATLQLYQTANSGAAINVAAYRLTKGWTEIQATWNVNQTGTNWITAGGDYNVSVNSTTSVTTTINAWKSFNITSLVQGWVNGSYPDYGLILVPLPPAGTNIKTFTSSDGTAAYRPRLIINYSVNNSGIFIQNETGIRNYSMNGTFSSTLFDNSVTYSVLLNSSLNATTGTLTSQIFDANYNVTWKNIQWSCMAIGPMADNHALETFGNGNVNMSKNVLLMHMEDMSGNITDSSGLGNHGKNYGATYFDTGKLGYGMNFDGLSNYIHIYDTPSLDLMNEGTISVWIYKRGNSTNGGVVHKGDLASWADEAFSLQYFPANITLYLLNSGGTSNTITGPILYDDRWYHIVAKWNQISAEIYVNGILTVTKANTIIPRNSAGGLNIGAQINVSPYYSFNGTMDELALWNISLTEPEVLSLYERGITRLNISAKSCALANCSDVNFTYLGNTQPDFKSVELSSSLFPLNRYFQYQFGFYTENSSWTPELYSVGINYTIPPSSILISPGNNIYTKINNISFRCNATDDTLLRNSTLYWNYTGIWDTNGTISVSGKNNQTIFNRTGLMDGQLLWNCLVCDNVSSCSFASSNYTVTIDTVSPQPTFVYPSDDTYAFVSRNWSFVNVSVSESVVSCVLNWSNSSFSVLSNLTNISLTSWFVNNSVSVDGFYSYFVSCVDYANNTGISERRNITIDRINPSVTIVYPSDTNNTIVARNWSFVNVSVSESVVSCVLNWSNVSFSVLSNLTNVSLTSWFVNNSVSVDGFYSYSVFCVDYANNTGISAKRNITIDTTPPIITFVDPTYPDGSQISINVTLINISLNENATICVLNWSGTVYNMINLSRLSWYYNKSNILDGAYNYIALCNDTMNNTGYSDLMTLRVNTSNTIYFTSLTTQDGSYIQNWIYVNVTSANTFAETIRFKLYNATGVLNSTNFTTNATRKYLAANYTGLPDGIYYINATSNDTFGHNSTTETRTITLDATPPSVVILIPQNGTIYDENTTLINITANVSDSVSLQSILMNLILSNGTNITVPMNLLSGKTYYYTLDTGKQLGVYTATIIANDSLNNINDTQKTVFRLRVQGKVIDIIDTTQTSIVYTQNITSNVSGVLSVDLYPLAHQIQKISIAGFNQYSTNSIIRIDTDIVSSDEYVQTYSINLDDLNYTSANFTFTAAAENLLKCVNFTFLTKTCNDDEYVSVLTDMIIGQNYTVAYNATDPGFYVTIQGSSVTRDSYIRQGTANTNYGTATSLRVGKTTNPNAHRTIIWFNISDLPSDATVQWANLSLYFYSIPSGNTNGDRTHVLHKVAPLRPWIENGVTWNRYNSTNLWTTAGGDYNSTISDSKTFNSASLNTWISFNVTADLQMFIINQSAYYGWIVKDSDEATLNTLRYYASKQYANTTVTPRLDYLLSDGTSGTYVINGTITKYTFFEGIFNNTKFGYSNYSIILKNSTTKNGTWTSQIFDALDNVSWYNISWYAKSYGELPNYDAIENRFSSGNVDMTGNILLMHLNNDSAYGESSTLFYDYSGSGNNGSCAGAACPTYTLNGKLRSAYIFDGGSDYIAVPYSSSIDISTNKLTIESWVRWNINPATGSASASIVNRNDVTIGWGLGHVTDNSRFRFYIGNPASAVASTTVPQQNIWYHVVGVYNGSTLNMYINGVLENTSSRSATVPTSASQLTIGRQAITAASYFNGVIDEVAVYNRELGPQEVLDRYKRGIVRMNLSARSCSVATCTGINFISVPEPSPQQLTLNTTNIPTNRYFQYRLYFEADNATYSPELNNVTLTYYRDLYLINTDINFSNNKPVENETITIFAKIRNDYNINYTNILVRFYDGDPDNDGVQIGQNKSINFTGIQNVTVNTTWNVPAGTHQVFVKIDPLNNIIETNKSNNKAYNTTFIPAWQIFYGNVTSLTQLGKSNDTNSIIINWSIKYYPDANVYIVPSGSSINWIALQALARNSTGGVNSSTYDDFSELDLSLGIETFADSINSTYSANGLPIKLTNYTLFYRNVTNVPEAESTNNSNFYTGILWDTSDTALSYYSYNSNPSLRTDIVFVTRLNYNKTGTYGNYDYELRVPAFLRNYGGVGETVQLYYEIQ